MHGQQNIKKKIRISMYGFVDFAVLLFHRCVPSFWNSNLPSFSRSNFIRFWKWI